MTGILPGGSLEAPEDEGWHWVWLGQRMSRWLCVYYSCGRPIWWRPRVVRQYGAVGVAWLCWCVAVAVDSPSEGVEEAA